MSSKYSAFTSKSDAGRLPVIITDVAVSQSKDLMPEGVSQPIKAIIAI